MLWLLVILKKNSLIFGHKQIERMKCVVIQKDKIHELKTFRFFNFDNIFKRTINYLLLQYMKMRSTLFYSNNMDDCTFCCKQITYQQ